MKIRKIKAMRGPNYWSIGRKKLIVMVLDLQKMEDYPSSEIPGFNDRLKKLLPGLYEHRCSVGVPGGFYERLDEGTWMGHVIEHVALEIQTMAGMDTGFGRTRGYGEKGVYHVVFSYIEENVGRFAAKAAVRICEALIAAQDYDLNPDILKMRKLRERGRLGPSTESIIKEAEKRGIPWIRLNKNSLCQIGYGANQQRIQATVTSKTSNIAVDIACSKPETKALLKSAAIPVPAGDLIYNIENLKETCERLGYPLVIKPSDGNHGRGITTGIVDFEDAEKAFNFAKEVSSGVIIEEEIKGYDYRFLVINYKLVAVAKRSPAHVIGDGKQSIQELIKETNKDTRRGYGHEKELTIIEADEITHLLLSEMNYDLQSIPKDGETVILKDTANLSTGGTAEDVTDIVHSSNVMMAERIARIVGLDICGIDIMTTDVSKPLVETKGSVLEVNAGPGFRMHLAPTKGLPRNVAAPVIDQLFPGKNPESRIPIVAVTGTNGKTTTTRLIARIAKFSGYSVGYTTSDGIYIKNQLIMRGDCTGPVSTEFVLKDPTVNFAVLECARGGLLRSGLGFNKCDIGIVTNVSGDHLGLDGINTIEQLTRVKAVIPETVKEDGYAILNADDERVYNMRHNLKCNVALFSMDENNPVIKEFQEDGGITAIYENGFVTITNGIWKMRIMKAKAIPLTFDGRAEFMIQNILPAILSAHLQGINIEDIRAALETFSSTRFQTPGRLNMYQFKEFKILLDYAHNPPGMRALKKFTDTYTDSYKIGIVAGIGDRKTEDTEELGAISTEMFDEIVIRQDKHLRGKTAEELLGMLEKGIRRKDQNIKVSVIPSELEAIQYAIKACPENGLIILCSDVISEALDYISKLKEEEDKGKNIRENPIPAEV